jgi:hypothetical protein
MSKLVVGPHPSSLEKTPQRRPKLSESPRSEPGNRLFGSEKTNNGRQSSVTSISTVATCDSLSTPDSKWSSIRKQKKSGKSLSMTWSGKQSRNLVRSQSVLRLTGSKKKKKKSPRTTILKPLKLKGTVPLTPFRELKEKVRVMQDLKNPKWEERLDAMDRVRELFAQDGLLGARSWPQIEPLFKEAIIAQLASLRSSIVAKACRILCEMCDILGEGSADLVQYFVPHVCKGLFVTVKVIASTTRDCLRHMVVTQGSFALLPVLLKGVADDHPPVRQNCLQCMGLLLGEELAPNKDDKKARSRISKALKIGVSDGDPATRKAGRELFQDLKRVWPEPAASLFLKLPSDVQRAIKRDQQDPSKPKASARRKNWTMSLKRSSVRKTFARHGSAKSMMNLGGVVSVSSPQLTTPISPRSPRSAPPSESGHAGPPGGISPE